MGTMLKKILAFGPIYWGTGDVPAAREDHTGLPLCEENPVTGEGNLLDGPLKYFLFAEEVPEVHLALFRFRAVYVFEVEFLFALLVNIRIEITHSTSGKYADSYNICGKSNFSASPGV